MKLEQLHEARYSGQHPLITQIKHAVDNNKRTTIQSEISIEDMRELISNELGEPKEYPPHDGSFVQYAWSSRSNNSIVTLTDQRWFAVVHILPY